MKTSNFLLPLELEACQSRGSIGPFVKERGRVSLPLEEMGCIPNYKTNGWLYSKVQDTVRAEPSPCSGTCGWTSPAPRGCYWGPPASEVLQAWRLWLAVGRSGSAVCRCSKVKGLGALEEGSLALDLNWERKPCFCVESTALCYDNASSSVVLGGEQSRACRTHLLCTLCCSGNVP